MSKVRIHNLVVSLDGFATGEGPSFDSPFGHAQDVMMTCSFAARSRIRALSSGGCEPGSP
jgi:hypothetical protein